MGKSRIYEIAKELNIDSKLIVEKLKENECRCKNHMSSNYRRRSMKIRQAFQKPATKQQEPVRETAGKKPAARPQEERQKQDAANQVVITVIRENGKRICHRNRSETAK